MGSTESSEGRRVSFGMDEEERVRVLQGIRLSENVVHRMKDSSPPAEGQQPAPQQEPRLPRSETNDGQQLLGVKEDLKRFRQEQATVQDELFQVVKREREAAAKHLPLAPPVVESGTDQEEQQSARLARELGSKEAELRRCDTFFQEQLGHIERKEQTRGCAEAKQEKGKCRTQAKEPEPRRAKAEMYKLSSQQFHEAASKAENTIKPRRVEPVCSGLQAQILRCYRDHAHEVLLCSDLVKAYQRCVCASAAHKG
ncbi:MICOS complex subunit MIC25 isoform X2 [Cavia porcellus]|uniref:MICOS complex subunit MIC25 isoform X2 n=1 Tax=Cavia porcellus TaxID=10141 RepID=UPI002FE3F010